MAGVGLVVSATSAGPHGRPVSASDGNKRIGRSAPRLGCLWDNAARRVRSAPADSRVPG